MEMELEVQCNEIKLDDDKLDMCIDDIKAERERAKHNDRTKEVEIKLDIDCNDDRTEEMDSVVAQEYKKKVEFNILTKKGKIELNIMDEELVSDDVKDKINMLNNHPTSGIAIKSIIIKIPKMECKNKPTNPFKLEASPFSRKAYRVDLSPP